MRPKPLTRGTPVIIDTCDEPSARMVAILMNYDSKKGYWKARYLSKFTRMQICWNGCPTPLAAFGVALKVQGDQYQVVPTGKPCTATYEDGLARRWQERFDGTWRDGRPLALKLLNRDMVAA